MRHKFQNGAHGIPSTSLPVSVRSMGYDAREFLDKSASEEPIAISSTLEAIAFYTAHLGLQGWMYVDVRG